MYLPPGRKRFARGEEGRERERKHFFFFSLAHPTPHLLAMASRETPASLRAFFSNPLLYRNICILAHVDHGKTTLTDCLLSSNHIVSAKQAGQVRYMDSTEEEQARGITMKSSAIALVHTDEPYRELRATAASPPTPVRYLINLIDSPGHVDFSMDVVTAARLCDGAIVVVDAVEGVCIQTHAVLRSAWQEGVRPLLLINKLDRLVCELKLTPLEAYVHINRIIEGVNVIMNSLFRAEAMGAAAAAVAPPPPPSAQQAQEAQEREISDGSPLTISTDTWAFAVDEAAERALFFDPSKGNVLFASAVDGWAFTVDDFARMHSARLGLSVPLLRRALWGPWYYKAKAKQVVTGTAAADAAKGRCMAVSMMLENVWAVYGALLVTPCEERAGKIFAALGMGDKLPARELAASREARSRLQTVMRAWLPLHHAVLSTVCRVLPSPREAQAKRVDKLWPVETLAAAAAAAEGGGLAPLTPDITLAQRLARVRADIAACASGDDAECVVFVSKMFAVPTAALPPPPRSEGEGQGCSGSSGSSGSSDEPPSVPSASALWGLGSDSALGELLDSKPWAVAAGDGGGGSGLQETFVAFARVFSGVLRPHSPVFVLGPKYSPADPALASKHCLAARVGACYLMMGRELLPLLEARAGQVVGLGGLGGKVLKSATLATSPACASLSTMTFQTTPLVRVALSPVRTADLALLEAGLALLDAADPCVEVTVTDAGELQLASLGELHLQRCITDLETRFARCAIHVSPPILEFQETLIAGAALSAVPPPRVPQQEGGADWQGQDTAAAAAPPPPFSSGGDGSSAGGAGAAAAGDSSGGMAAASNPLLFSSALLSPGGEGSGSPAYPISWTPALLTTSDAYLHVPSGAVYVTTSDKACTLRFRVLPHPPPLTALLSRADCVGAIREVTAERSAEVLAWQAPALSAAAAAFTASFEGLLAAAGAPWSELASGACVCALGPKRVGPNVLFAAPSVFQGLGAALWGGQASCGGAAGAPESAPAAPAAALLALRAALTYGFTMSMSSGPLAGEPMRGIGVILEEVALHGSPPRAPSSGLVIQAARDAVATGLAAGSLRLVEAVYLCELRCSGGLGGGGEALGKCYGVLAKRRGRVVAEDLMEGTDTWLISAHLPVVEIYGFADELRKRTSGAATSPQLLFSHWEVIDADPFFTPTSEAEREEMGDMVHKGQVRVATSVPPPFFVCDLRAMGLAVFTNLMHPPPPPLPPQQKHCRVAILRGGLLTVCGREKASPSLKSSCMTRRSSAIEKSESY